MPSRERPQGVERNIVVTTWDWGDPQHYLHDLIASDRRNPTVNAYGPLFGSTEYATDDLPILNPVTNTPSTFHAPVRDKDMPELLGPGHAAMKTPFAASAYWGMEKMWDSKVNNHNSMIDQAGRRVARGGDPRRPTIRTSARRAPTIRRPSSSRSRRTCARSACSIRRR